LFPRGDKLGCLVADPLLTEGFVARAACRDTDIVVHPVLGRLAFGHLQETDGWWQDAVWIDKHSSVVEVIARLVHIAQLPEVREPMRIVRVRR
jgi:hypothetical protein